MQLIYKVYLTIKYLLLYTESHLNPRHFVDLQVTYFVIVGLY